MLTALPLLRLHATHGALRAVAPARCLSMAVAAPAQAAAAATASPRTRPLTALKHLPTAMQAVVQRRHRVAHWQRVHDDWVRRGQQSHTFPRCLATSHATRKRESWLARLRQWARIVAHLWRLLALAAPLVVTAPLVLALRRLSPAMERAWWAYACWAAQRSSPTVMKFLQWASTRRDMFPAAFCDRFERFHEHAPEHPWRDTQHVLRQAFGHDWQRVLSLERTPIGSGCIAQVYKGVLLATGEDVAVKVIHPHIKQLVALDLELLRGAVWLIECVPRLHLLSARESLDEFALLMNRQLNLRAEAENLTKFGAHFRDRRGIRFPVPHMEFTTENVLTESFENGVHFCDLETAAALSNPRERKAMARVVLDAYLRMVFLDNFAHGDLHPGNLLFDMAALESTTGGASTARSVVAIDAGIVTRLEPDDLRNFVELFHAVATGNGYKAGELIVSRSKPRGSTEDTPAAEKCTDLEAFCSGMERIVSNAVAWQLRLEKVHVGTLLREVLELCCHHEVKLEGKYASIVISIAVLEGVGRKLDPELDVLGVALPIIAQSLVNHVWRK